MLAAKHKDTENYLYKVVGRGAMMALLSEKLGLYESLGHCHGDNHYVN